ncbi:murein biosynthesis integral membrane protein MurJ [Peptoniphilus sp.]|uniref:murein biosynthesis integral membrane protein MurJ n=1 Tax=Peptoniphilus sp. TaxID=1971214 RepID=UPI002A81567D|nr:murein biosynthesis integral membrane protein MurJ [Peptoniphilus sp.]MDY3902380.1 murein biosynthesis integral membrane protein MurJ [Peptoniphilus sp.]
MENKDNTGSRIAKSTLAITIFLLIGKVFGFFRESLTAYVFGAGTEMDAFSLAQAATAMISSFVTQAIATTYIPSAQKAEMDHGPSRKNYFTNNLLMVASLVSFVLIILGIIFPNQIALLTASQAEPETYAIVVKLIQVGMPVVLFSSWVGIMEGYLQHGGKFAATGAIAIPLNLTYIIYLALFSKHVGIMGLTIASVLGVLAEFLFLLPNAIKIGYRPKFIADFKDKYVREAIILALPVFVSVSVNDINTIVNRNLASGMGKGAASILYYSNKMNTMIIGIFITAITAIVFPILTKTLGSGDMKLGKKVMNASIKTVLFITVPATVGLIILARPIIEIAFVRGSFTATDGIAATSTLRCYSLSLISISVINVLNRIYYSIKDTRTPFYVGVTNVIINVGLNLLVARHYGTNGLAASVSIATTIALFISFILLRRKIGNLGTKSYIKALIKTLMAAFIMGLVTLSYFPYEKLIMSFAPSSLHTILRLILLMIIVFIAACIYLLCLYKLGVREVRDVVGIIKNKIESRKKLA